MSKTDFQRCNECNKVLDMTCSCSPDNYIVQLPVFDHVCKSELRAWCEAVKGPSPENYVEYDLGFYNAVQLILQRFCAGEL